MKLRNFFSVLLAVLAVTAPDVFASTATGMPQEQGLSVMQSFFTGTVALTCLVLGCVLLGVKIFRGGEMGEIASNAVNYIMGGAFASAAVSVVGILFGMSGAII